MITNDVDKCRHILQNLVGNAVKFTEKGVVEVSAIQSDGHFEILVMMPALESPMPILFTFLTSSGKQMEELPEDMEGTGLGLAIAKKYANLLGGDISVKSKFGRALHLLLLCRLIIQLKTKLFR